VNMINTCFFLGTRFLDELSFEDGHAESSPMVDVGDLHMKHLGTIDGVFNSFNLRGMGFIPIFLTLLFLMEIDSIPLNGRKTLLDTLTTQHGCLPRLRSSDDRRN
jgi:hypothetical protein